MRRLILISVLLLITWPAAAGVEQRQQASRLLNAYLAEHGPRQKAIAQPPVAIEERLTICGYCHGKDGNSTHADIPSLAGQNPVYVVEQLLVFRTGERYPVMMHGFAKNLTDQEAVAAGLHYSSLPRTSTMETDPELAAAGAPLYQQQCAACHGEDGAGVSEDSAVISAQRPDYLITTMTRFRDPNEQRQSHEMGAEAVKLSDAQIKALAHYIGDLGG